VTKQHLIWWIFTFLRQHHRTVFDDMCERLIGDAQDRWVKAGLAERLEAYEKVAPAGYKFLAEFKREGQGSTWEDLVVAHGDWDKAQSQASARLGGADKVDMIILSESDLTTMHLRKGQIRTKDGILELTPHD
jgi:hypothetical protein